MLKAIAIAVPIWQQWASKDNMASVSWCSFSFCWPFVLKFFFYSDQVSHCHDFILVGFCSHKPKSLQYHIID